MSKEKIKSITTEYISIVTEEYENDPYYKSQTITTYPNGTVETTFVLTKEYAKGLCVPYDAFDKICGVKKREPSFIKRLVNFISFWYGFLTGKK